MLEAAVVAAVLVVLVLLEGEKAKRSLAPSPIRAPEHRAEASLWPVRTA